MCEATTAIMVGTALAGAVVSAHGTLEAGKAQEQIARENAQIADWQRGDVLRRGQMEVDAIRQEARSINADLEVELGASNIESTTGSSATMMASSLMQAERDVAITRANAARGAWGLENEARDLETQGRMARRSSYLTSLGTGLNFIGSASSTLAQRPRGAK